MRIHVQTPHGDPDFSFTAAQVDAALGGVLDYRLTVGHTPADFAAVADEVELLIATPNQIRALGKLAAPRLRIVALNAAGVDALAPFDWLPDGAVLLNNRGTHAGKASEYIAMACLMLAARVPALATAQRDGVWRPIFASPLAGRRVAIVGTGDIGSAGARALKALGVAATGIRSRAAPHADFAAVHGADDLDRLLPQTDILVLTCPLTTATAGLLSRQRIGLLPPGAGVVNIGRGRLLDQDALCDALDAGALGGAVLDVFDPEPIPAGHRLWSTPNLVITPHVSCDDPATYNARTLAILAANLRAWQAGQPLPNQVDLARGY